MSLCSLKKCVNNLLRHTLLPQKCLSCSTPVDNCLCQLCQHGITFINIVKPESLRLFEKNAMMEHLATRLEKVVSIPMIEIIGAYTVVALAGVNKNGRFKGRPFQVMHSENFKRLKKYISSLYDPNLKTVDVYLY